MNNTKVISARVPLEDYTALLKRAKDAKMNITDFIIDTLFGKDEKEIITNQEINDLKSEVSNLRKDHITVMQEYDRATTKFQNLTQEKHDLEKHILNLKEKHNDFVKTTWNNTKSKEGIFLYPEELEFIKKQLWE